MFTVRSGDYHLNNNNDDGQIQVLDIFTIFVIQNTIKHNLHQVSVNKVHKSIEV